MAIAGRKPKPTKIHLLNGNPSRLNLDARMASEPKPKPIAPDCPEHLDDAARAEWFATAPELERVGLLTLLDKAAFAAYCQVYSRWVNAEEHIKKHGLLIKSPNGYPMPNPYLNIATRALDQMMRLLVEFGLSPSARSRIEVKTPSEDPDPMERLLGDSKRRA